MKPRDPRVVDLLNEALSLELSIVNTYFLHARMLANWGLDGLGQEFYRLSIGEMKDADELIQRVLMFDGHPNVQRLRPLHIGESPLEMLTLGLAGEIDAVAAFTAAAAECRALGDLGTAAVFEEMVRDEEAHADWFEGQLAAIESVGLEGYLAQHISAAG